MFGTRHMQTHSPQRIISEGPHGSRHSLGVFLPPTLFPESLQCGKGSVLTSSPPVFSTEWNTENIQQKVCYLGPRRVPTCSVLNSSARPCPKTHTNSYSEALTPNMVVCGSGAFGRKSGLEEVVGVSPHGGIGVLTRKGRDTRASSFHLVRTQQEAGCPPARKRAHTKTHICWHLDLGLACLQS